MVRPKSNSHLGCNNNGHTTLTHWVAPSEIGSDPLSSQEDNRHNQKKRRLYRDHTPTHPFREIDTNLRASNNYSPTHTKKQRQEDTEGLIWE